jgi:hypothetical protein
MSAHQKIELKCPRCDNKSETSVWVSINVTIDPDAKEALLNGKINVFRCGHCNFEEPLNTDLLYHDMQNRFCVQFYHFNIIKEKQFLDMFNEDAEQQLDMPEVPFDNYMKHIHIVFSMAELVRYVLFRDNLARRKGSINNGQLVCFCCGSNIRKGDNYYCAARRRHIKGDAGEDSDCIKDATSSLQVCTGCLTKAASGGIEFSNLAIPLLHVEKEELHNFANRRIDTKIDLELPGKSRDLCSFCAGEIRVGDQYTRLTMGEEVEGGSGIRSVSEYTFAVLCKACSDNYMAWT